MISKYDENNDFVLYDREIVTDEKVMGKPSGEKRNANDKDIALLK